MYQNGSDNHSLSQGGSEVLPGRLSLANKASGDNYGEISAEEQRGKSSTNRCGRCLDRHRLEIVSYLLMFSWYLIEISSITMILDKVCLVHFNYSHEICSNLDNYTEIKTDVEDMATNYQLGHSLIQTAPAVLISCFVGPWSDKYGRKVPVLIATAGMFLNTLGSSTCAYLFYSRVEYYFIPAIFTGLTGGVVTFLTVIYSYASDVTPEALRTLKYAFVAMAVGLSQPAGNGAGGWIYKFWGFPAVFMTSAAGLAVSFVAVVFFLPETRGHENTDPLTTKLKNLFTIETLKEGFNAIKKKRPNQGRKQILLLIIAMCFIVIATNSTRDVSYLFAHHEYNWDNTTYSTIIAIYSVISVVMLVIVVPVFKYIRAGDHTLGLVGTISILLKYIGIGVASKVSIYHIANVLGCLGGVASMAGRSRISKVVPNDDLGKVFSFVATAEAFIPVLTTIAITQIFRAFLKIYPAMPYIVLAFCLIFPIGVFGWLTRFANRKATYDNMDKETNEETSRSNNV